MEGIVVEIIEKYLEAELAKQQRKYLRLKYDEDAKYYFQNGYSEDAALHADIIISFWTIYRTVLEKETGWNAYKTPKSLDSLLRQIRSKRRNDFTSNIIQINEKLEDFAKVIYTKGNYMLLPNGKRAMNNERYERFEDRIDMTVYHSFSGGKLSQYFETDEILCEWIVREKLDILFTDGDIKKEKLIWLLNNEKRITDMKLSEIYSYIDSAMSFIKNRSANI